MLLSLVLILKPEEEISAPAWLGRASHAVFLEWVRKADPLLAEQLHDDSGIKPFTTSSLWGASFMSSAVKLLKPDREYYLRFTVFDKSISNLLKEVVLSNSPSEIFLEGCHLKVKEITLDCEQHPWSRTASYEDLINKHLIALNPPESKIYLTFASPTTFRSQEKNFPLPLPGLVFGSLLEKWNAFAPIALNPELKRYAEECLALAQYTLRTYIISVAGGKQVGFTGICRYTALNRDPYWLRQINLLGDFAFFSGVGAKTTMGMGQTRRMENARSLYR